MQLHYYLLAKMLSGRILTTPTVIPQWKSDPSISAWIPKALKGTTDFLI